MYNWVLHTLLTTLEDSHMGGSPSPEVPDCTKNKLEHCGLVLKCVDDVVDNGALVTVAQLLREPKMRHRSLIITAHAYACSRKHSLLSWGNGRTWSPELSC
jgi:hypothetical protein